MLVALSVYEWWACDGDDRSAYLQEDCAREHLPLQFVVLDLAGDLATRCNRCLPSQDMYSLGSAAYISGPLYGLRAL
jgi:hypothetical protein